MKKINELISEKILEVLENNDSILLNTITEINCTNGNFNDYQVYNNDEEFFNMFFYNKPIEVAKAISYGNYRYNDSFVMFDNYGNLESFDYITQVISDSLLEDIIEDILENHNCYNLDTEIEIYLNLLSNEEEQFALYQSIINELMKDDANGFYDEILEDNNYYLEDAFYDLEQILNNLINDKEYVEVKEKYLKLLEKIESIEE